MNRWKSSSKSWVLVWGVTFFVGVMILCTGHQSSLVQSSPERAQKMTQEKLQAVSAPVQVQEAIALEIGNTGAARIQTDPGKKVLSIKEFPSPVNGSILRNMGNYYLDSFADYLFHAGTDYAEPEGTMIRATHGGYVVYAGPDAILGQKVTLDCGDGWIVTYGGLDNLRIQDGETVVTQGVLGQVRFFPGAEGESDQPQLHYEVWHGNDVQRPE